MTCLQNDNRI